MSRSRRKAFMKISRTLKKKSRSTCDHLTDRSRIKSVFLGFIDHPEWKTSTGARYFARRYSILRGYHLARCLKIMNIIPDKNMALNIPYKTHCANSRFFRIRSCCSCGSFGLLRSSIFQS